MIVEIVQADANGLARGAIAGGNSPKSWACAVRPAPARQCGDSYGGVTNKWTPIPYPAVPGAFPLRLILDHNPGNFRDLIDGSPILVPGGFATLDIAGWVPNGCYQVCSWNPDVEDFRPVGGSKVWTTTSVTAPVVNGSGNPAGILLPTVASSRLVPTVKLYPGDRALTMYFNATGGAGADIFLGTSSGATNKTNSGGAYVSPAEKILAVADFNANNTAVITRQDLLGENWLYLYASVAGVYCEIEKVSEVG